MRNYSFSLSQGYAGWVSIPFDVAPSGSISAVLTKRGIPVGNLSNSSFIKDGTNLRFTIGASYAVPANNGMSYSISDSTGVIAVGKIYVNAPPSDGNVDLSNYYNKTEVDSKIPDLSAYYTKTQIDASLAAKANTSAVYTKAQSDSAVAAAKLATFNLFANGSLIVRTGTSKLRNPGRSITLSRVYIDVGTAPVGAALIIDVKKNGVSLWTNPVNRPTIADGATSASSVPTNTSFADGDYLTVDIVQIGTTTPGADLTVMVAGA